MATTAFAKRVLRFGPFELNLATGELRKCEILIKLRPQAARVLVLLASRSGEAVTREQLRDLVWGSGYFVDFEHALNVCIRQVRAALNDDAEKPRYIETIPRVGYRFIARVIVPNSSSISPAAAAMDVAFAEPQPEILPSRIAQSRQWVVGAVVLALIVVLVLGLAIRERLLRNSQQLHIESLAVLPLTNLSGDPEQEYFADGMTDELITDLAKIRALRVVSHTSVMRYKHTTASLLQLGKELNVGAVVEGSVMRSGDRVRISAQLIETSTDRHLWAESYERELRNVLELQDDIARAIANQVQAKLTPQEEARIVAATKKVDPEAYELYLKGRYEWAKRGKEGLTKGLEFFKQAVARDPNYAPAYAGIAESYSMLGNNQFMPGDQVFPSAKSAALKALELDPNLSDAHTALAEILNDYEWNWIAAEREYKRAIELNSNDATAHHWYAMSLVWVGRSTEAINEIERARELDPVAVHVNANVGLVLLWAREYDRALVAAQRTLELEPAEPTSQVVLGMYYLHRGDLEKGIDEFRTNVASSPYESPRLAGLVYAYAMAGRKEKALSVLHNLKVLCVHTYCSPTSMAIAYGALGQNDEAFAWLDKALLKPGATNLNSIKVNPSFDPLRSDPRFRDVLRRRGLEP